MEDSGNISEHLQHSLDNASLVDKDLKQLIKVQGLISMPVIIGVGLFGNFMVVVKMSQSMRSRLASHALLCALAICDIGFLLTLLVQWLDKSLGLFKVDPNRTAARILTYCAQLCDMASVWLIVGLSCERYIVLFYPHLRRRFCTIRNAKMLIFAVVLLSALFCVWVLAIALPSSTNVEDLYFWMNISDMFLACFIPSVIILVLNIIITRQLKRYYTKRVTLVLSKALECVNSPNSVYVPISSTKLEKRSERELTKSLIRVTSIYILMNLPNYLFRFIADITAIFKLQIQYEKRAEVEHVLEWLVYMLYYIHHAINFYLYTFYGNAMRKKFWDLCRTIAVWCCLCECFNVCGCLNANELENY